MSNKYGAKKSVGLFSGRMYDSGAERDRADELHSMEHASEIYGLVEQPRIELVPGKFYKPDFAYQPLTVTMRDGHSYPVTTPTELVYEDVKGVETERWRLIKGLWPYLGPGDLHMLKRAGRDREWRVKVISSYGTRDALWAIMEAARC